jgi:hypothetical protein
MALLVSGLTFFWLQPSHQRDLGSRTRDPPPAHRGKPERIFNRVRDKTANALEHGPWLPWNLAHDRGGAMFAEGLRQPPQRMSHNSDVRGRENRGRVITMELDQVTSPGFTAIGVRMGREAGKFCRGDEAYSHRARLPDGRSDSASRFRLEPTHSLLLKVRLGRNLITLFSTVNTLREKKSVGARAAGGKGRSRTRRADAVRGRLTSTRPLHRKTKIALFK